MWQKKASKLELAASMVRPPQRTDKKGRPASHGKKLSIQDDFTLSDEKIGDYYMAVRRVLTIQQQGYYL